MEAGDTTRSVTQLLLRWRRGEAGALEQLMPLVYQELRRLAGAQMRKERADHTLQPTALVHEAFVRMVDLELSWQDRVHFLSMAARLMRRVLVDHARAQRAEKRGGQALKVTLKEGRGMAAEPEWDLVALDEALERLRALEERPGEAVELHYFGGLSYREIAEALGVSEATVERDLRFARAWLRKELEGPGDES